MTDEATATLLSGITGDDGSTIDLGAEISSARANTPSTSGPTAPRLTREAAAALFEGKEVTSLLDAGSARKLQRRLLTFVIDGAACLPGAFVSAEGDYLDVEITLRSLSSQEELDALQALEKAAPAPYAFARKSLWKIGGHPLTEEQKRVAWELLGPAGRALCVLAFQQLSNVSMSVLGKYQASISQS